MSACRSDLAQALFGPHEIGPAVAALRQLMRAYESACEVGRSPWEFALEAACLRDLGVTHTQLRVLLCHGYLEQGLEESSLEDAQRRFRRVANLSLAPRTCFVLTEAGAAFARRLCASQDNHATAAQQERPSWDRDRRELRFGGTVVKRFKQPAPNQELVLAAFEEEGWPPRVFDPLAPAGEQNGKRRLHSTINNLNRGHVRALIHFEGGGDGLSIGWRALAGDG